MNDKLEYYRIQIDKLDDQLLGVLAKRINIVRKIGKFKKAHEIKPFDEKRWQEVLESKLSKAHILNLSKSFIKKLYDFIHAYSLEVERESRKNEKS